MSTTLPEAPTIPLPPYRPVEELLVELESLDDPQLIAEALEDEEILGTPCNAGLCAIAVYLQRHSGLDEVNVGAFDALRWRPAPTPDDSWVLGPVVREFIARFDSGSYPNLMWPDERAKWTEDA